MKVYTRKGDKGTTQLIGGTRVPKSSLRIEAYGTVDELNSHLGLLKDQHPEMQRIHEQLLDIQDRLFTLGSLLAADPESSSMKLPPIHSEDALRLENWIDEMDNELEPMRQFLLPGGHSTVSICHIARCVCRRAERIIVDLDAVEPVQEEILVYMNRLSDYLFTLSRKLAKDLNAVEHPWNPKM